MIDVSIGKEGTKINVAGTFKDRAKTINGKVQHMPN